MRRTAAAIGGVVAVLASLAVVTLASRGEPGDRTAAAFEAASVGRTVFFSVLGLALVICAALAVWALWPDGSGTPRSAPPSRWLPYLVIAALILLLAVLAPERPAPPEGADAPPAAPLGDEGDEPGDDLAPEGRASPTASLLVAALALAGLAAFTLVLRRRRDDVADGAVRADEDRPGGAPSSSLDAELVAAIDAGDVDAAIAAVAAEPDPRRAVLLAYAVLDARLATSAAARVPTSTPHEWLQRIRAAYGASQPDVVEGSRRLTALYERARFGNRPMSPDHRAEAVSALQPLRRLSTSEATR